MFTDVEGSTRRWEADADGMRVALAAHDEVLRKAMEAHGGCLEMQSELGAGTTITVVLPADRVVQRSLCAA